MDLKQAILSGERFKRSGAEPVWRNKEGYIDAEGRYEGDVLTTEDIVATDWIIVKGITKDDLLAAVEKVNEVVGGGISQYHAKFLIKQLGLE